MRYVELLDAIGWRRYSGREQTCLLALLAGDGLTGSCEARVRFGSVTTGRQRVWAGWFVAVQHDSKEWLADDPHNLRAALRAVERELNADGWSLQVIGLDPKWRESGLSANTGFGFHPSLKTAAHMLDYPTH